MRHRQRPGQRQLPVGGVRSSGSNGVRIAVAVDYQPVGNAAQRRCQSGQGGARRGGDMGRAGGEQQHLGQGEHQTFVVPLDARGTQQRLLRQRRPQHFGQVVEIERRRRPYTVDRVTGGGFRQPEARPVDGRGQGVNAQAGDAGGSTAAIANSITMKVSISESRSAKLTIQVRRASLSTPLTEA